MMRRFTVESRDRVAGVELRQSAPPVRWSFPAGRNCSRSAFTLIEMLVALALSTVVISAVYGAIHLQWKVRTASEDQVQTARRVHGVVQDLTFDLRTCRRPDDTSENEASNPDDSAFLQESLLQSGPDIRERVLQLEAVLEQVQLIDFVGLPDALLLTTAQKSPRFPESQSVGTRQVVWLVNAGRDVRLLFGTSETHRYQFELRAAGRPLGLTRIEIPSPKREPKRLHDVTNTNASWMLIDESVVSFRLRFFDGRQWQSSWDSSESGCLPQAIEVALTHASPRTDAERGITPEQAEVSRVVIRVPQAGGAR